MDITLFYMDNRLLIQSIYTFVVVLCCLIVYFRTLKLYKATGYDGIKYFFMAFLYYALGFITIFAYGWRILLGNLGKSVVMNYIPILLEYFLIMGGFYITYSLLWKKFLDDTWISRIILLHMIAIIIALADMFYTHAYLMFIMELVIGIYAAIIIYTNYMDNKSQKFTQFYFISMVCNVLGWLMYFAGYITNNDYPIMMLYTYIIIMLAFIFLLYGVLGLERNNGKKA